MARLGLGTAAPYFVPTLAFWCLGIARSNPFQVIRMLRSIPRRSVLTGLLVLPATLSLVGCNDSGEAKAQSADTSTGQAPAKAPEPQGSVDVAKLMQPGPLPDQVMGKADAPVTIVEYASMTCPHCAHFAAATLPELKTKYIDHRQGQADPARVSLRSARRGRVHARPLLERQLSSRWSRCCSSSSRTGLR